MARSSHLVRVIIQRIDRLTTSIGQSIAWLTLAMMIITTLIVVLRYVFNIGSIAIQESVTYLHAIVFLLGAAYALQRGGHVRVDIFYQNFSPRRQALIDIVGSLLLLIPTCLFITWSCWEYVLAAWEVKEASQDPGGIPAVFILKTLILLMAVTLIIQGVAEILRNILLFIETNDSASKNPVDLPPHRRNKI